MANADNSLFGQTAVVTGSSSGIGRAIAIALARAGANLIVHARTNRGGADQTADAVRSLGREALVTLADLSNPFQQDNLITQAWDRSSIDIWINNAGADVLTGEAANWPFEAKLDVLWKVDVVATLRLSRAVGERMRQRGRGAIINIGWDQADTGMAGDSGQLFAAVKGAVMAATRSLAKSFAPNVRVNCIAPGWIRTDWGHQASEMWNNIAIGDALVARWGEPEDIAHVARFLASPEAAFVNGQVIAVNGGRNDSMKWASE